MAIFCKRECHLQRANDGSKLIVWTILYKVQFNYLPLENILRSA